MRCLKMNEIEVKEVLFATPLNFDQSGPIVQSIVSLTSSLRGQLVKCFMTLKPDTLIFLLEK